MLRIAIVDDENKFLDFYKRIVAETFSEYHVVVELKTFNNGNAFIKSLSGNKYDLVFMDIDMPELSGIDIAAELRNNNANFDLTFVLLIKSINMLSLMTLTEYLELFIITYEKNIQNWNIQAVTKI